MKRLKLLGIPINKTQIIGIVIALITIVLDFVFLNDQKELFYFIMGIAFLMGGLPFFLFLIIETRDKREKESMFLEFSRNLVENVRSGTPISRAILNIKTKDYGVLNPHINKLSNQISIGIPLKTAFETFARDLDSITITRAINIISESEKAGGQIEDILESVVKSVAQIQKLKKERRSAMFSLIVQGYIIFLIFIVIMLVMEFKILPIATGFGEFDQEFSGTTGIGGLSNPGGVATPEELTKPFLWLLVVQSIFTGLIIGKLAEGSIRAGMKHSFILLVTSILINTGAKVIFG
jgi:archaeal flagellar protein FlaJ